MFNVFDPQFLFCIKGDNHPMQLFQRPNKMLRWYAVVVLLIPLKWSVNYFVLKKNPKHSWLIITIFMLMFMSLLVNWDLADLCCWWLSFRLWVVDCLGCGLGCVLLHVYLLSKQKGQQLSMACFSPGESPEYKSRTKPHKHIYDFCLHYSHENSIGQGK